MLCQNCGETINTNQPYFSAGNNNTIFCSRDCCYKGFEGFYTRKEVDQTMKTYEHINNDTPAEKESKSTINDPGAVFDVANVLEDALMAKPPYVFEIRGANGTNEETSNDRERLLEFYMEWAMERLYQLVEENE